MILVCPRCKEENDIRVPIDPKTRYYCNWCGWVFDITGKGGIFCPQCKTRAAEPSIHTVGPEWVRFQQGLCPTCRTPLINEDMAPRATTAQPTSSLDSIGVPIRTISSQSEQRLDPKGKIKGITYVVRREEELLPTLLQRIRESQAHQVLVTGLAAFNTLYHSTDTIVSSLPGQWTILAPPYGPTHEDVLQQLDTFAKGIHSNPNKRQLCFGPTEPHDVITHLFYTTPNGFYKAAIFEIGLSPRIITTLSIMMSAINTKGRSPGCIEHIFSIDGSWLSTGMQEELSKSWGQPSRVSQLAWEAMDILERYDPSRRQKSRKWWPFS